MNIDGDVITFQFILSPSETIAIDVLIMNEKCYFRFPHPKYAKEAYEYDIKTGVKNVTFIRKQASLMYTYPRKKRKELREMIIKILKERGGIEANPN